MPVTVLIPMQRSRPTLNKCSFTANLFSRLIIASSSTVTSFKGNIYVGRDMR